MRRRWPNWNGWDTGRHVLHLPTTVVVLGVEETEAEVREEAGTGVIGLAPEAARVERVEEGTGRVGSPSPSRRRRRRRAEVAMVVGLLSVGVGVGGLEV